MRWEKTKIGDFLYERKDKFDPNDPKLSKYKKIEKIDFSQGKIFLTTYSPTKTKQIIVKNGDFVFSGLNIEKGAVAINNTGEDLVVSANYSSCEINYSIIEQKFFQYFIKSDAFKKLLKDNLKKDYGFTRPKHLVSLEINLPDMKIQNEIVQKLQSVESEISDLSHEVSYQKKLLIKLRQSILQDAIEGKLTASWRDENPVVEDASILLEKIKAEKEQLIQKKKIKKQKTCSSITDEEKLFILPKGWVWCRLEEICDFITKGTTPPASQLLENGEIPYLKVYNIVNQKINFDYKPQFINRDTHEKLLNRSRVFPNDVLMNIVGPPLGKIALVPNNHPEWNINQAIAIFRAINPEMSNYIYYYLREGAPVRAVELKGVVGQDNISLTQCRELIMALPTLPEQKEIVKRIEHLFSMCDDLEEQINSSKTNTDTLMQAVLKEAFENDK